MLAYIFLALGLVSLTLFCVCRDKKSSTVAICWKTLTSVFFVATAIAATVYNKEGLLVSALLMVGGLVMGLIGDITLDFKIFLKGLPYEKAESDADNMTYIGMAAFAVGHILYITAATLRSPASKLTLLWSALVAIGLVACIFALSITVMKMRFGKYLIPSVLYAFLLSWFVVYSVWQTAIVGASVANVLLLVGAIMFIVSDLILSMTYFSKEEDYKKEGFLNPESKFMIVSNHVTYYIAQFAIAVAIMFI